MLQPLTKKSYLALGIILVLLIVFNFFGWLDFLKNGLRNLFIPIFTKTNEISVQMGDKYAFFKDRETFFEAYRRCEDSRTKDEADSAKVQLLQEENDNLKKVLEFKEKSNFKIVVARVIGKNTESTEQTILIDQGTEANLKIDQPVIVKDGILVGKIVKTDLGMSVVRLINDNRSKVAATVLNAERSLGVVEGGYGLSIKMNFIPRNETVLIGDQIITSGLEANMPRGLVIGNVTAIENETYQPFQGAVLTPGVDLSKLTIVSVILSQ